MHEDDPDKTPTPHANLLEVEIKTGLGMNVATVTRTIYFYTPKSKSSLCSVCKSDRHVGLGIDLVELGAGQIFICLDCMVKE